VRLPPFHWWRTVFFLIPAIAIYTIVLGLVSLVTGLFDSTGRWPHKCAQWWGRAILFTTGVKLRYAGRPLPPADQSCVFVANHSSIYDTPIWLAGIPRELRIMAKAALVYVPFIGWHLARSGHVLVNRKNPGAGIFKRMQRMARSGASLMLFPEGSRTPDGQVKTFKPGIFLLAIEHKLPIVPISISGSRVVMPKGRLMVRPATVEIMVHDAIPTAELKREDARKLARRVQEIVASGVKAI
jgi:1-acyl-sn-glycerol-3-phosphate acyltransferase